MVAPHTGSPAITVPMGFYGGYGLRAGLQGCWVWAAGAGTASRQAATRRQTQLPARQIFPTTDGLPAGLSFLGRPFDEPTVIRLAYAFEQATQHRRPPPLFPECRGALVEEDAPAAPNAG